MASNMKELKIDPYYVPTKVDVAELPIDLTILPSLKVIPLKKFIIE